MTTEQERLEKVVKTLERVKSETNQMVLQMSKSMSELEVIRSFNQTSLDFFNFVASISRKKGRENELKLGGYGTLYQNAIKMNVKMPIDNYTLIVLEYADQIYEVNEDFFMKKKMGTAKVEVGNEFSIVHSDVFKELWKTLDEADKQQIRDQVQSLTTYAHVYFFQTVFKTVK